MSASRGYGRRRGLTLLEVLAATVLLTMIVGAVLPALRRAGDVAEAAHPAVRLEQFRAAVDQLMTDEALAPPFAAGGGAIETHSVPWPGAEPDRPAIEIRYLGAAAGATFDGAPEHGWITFACDPWVISRWVEFETNEPSEDEHAPRPDDA